METIKGDKCTLFALTKRDLGILGWRGTCGVSRRMGFSVLSFYTTTTLEPHDVIYTRSPSCRDRQEIYTRASEQFQKIPDTPNIMCLTVSEDQRQPKLTCKRDLQSPLRPALGPSLAKIVSWIWHYLTRGTQRRRLLLFGAQGRMGGGAVTHLHGPSPSHPALTTTQTPRPQRSTSADVLLSPAAVFVLSGCCEGPSLQAAPRGRDGTSPASADIYSSFASHW